MALLAMGLALVGAVGATIADSAGRPFPSESPPVAILNDPGFASQASAVCQASLELVSPPGRSPPTDLRTLVTHLRALPVQVADRPAVSGWLAHWDTAASLLAGTTGRSAGATALSSGPTSRSQRGRLDTSLRGIDDFARVNGIPGCVL